MSNWMNDTLAPGDTIDVMPPAAFALRAAETRSWPSRERQRITPVLSIIKTALTTTARESLVYANRGSDSVTFADALERLRGVRRPPHGIITSTRRGFR
jgi:ferredoxin-NADP reductase